MQGAASTKLLFVINPVSGGKIKSDHEASIRKYFEGKPHHIEFYILTGKDDPASVSHHLKTINPDKVIAVGGDGTVKMLAQLTISTSFTLGIIPAGSANGMAKELDIPLDINEALEIILSGKQEKIDVIGINEKEICIHLSDIGLNAKLVKYFEASGIRGMWGYARGLFKVFSGRNNFIATIKTEKETIKRNAFMVVIANASKYGTGAIINPDGKVEDGLFEIVIIRKLKLFELIKMLFTHKPFDPEFTEVLHARTIELNTSHRTYFQIDGEFKGKISKLTAHICPGELNVMLPAH
jgi:diacylglycerol kinase (ATP)